MNDANQYRLCRLMVLMGTSLIVLHTWAHVLSPAMTRVTLPTFVHSAPDLREWPLHTYLPIG